MKYEDPFQIFVHHKRIWYIVDTIKIQSLMLQIYFY